MAMSCNLSHHPTNLCKFTKSQTTLFPNHLTLIRSKTKAVPQILNYSHHDSVIPRLQDEVYCRSEAQHFINKFQDKIIVVKYGGAAMNSNPLQIESVITDLVELSSVGMRIVFVHGGGPEINAHLVDLGIQPKFLNGLRVTDAETMDIVAKVLFKVNKRLVSLINRAGGKGIGLCGVDGRLITAQPSSKAAQLGFVGDVEKADSSLLSFLIEKNYIPVVASVAADKSCQLYNINADTVAGELAVALRAEKLILLTDVKGILEDKNDPGSLVKELNIEEVDKMIEDGKIAGGMIPKVNCCKRAILQGVNTASIIDGGLPHSLLFEILTDEGSGTMITQ